MMSVAEIKTLLDALVHAQALYDDALATWPGKQRMDDLRESMAALEEEKALFTEHFRDDVDCIEASIRDRVLTLGETVRGNVLMAVWSKPRVTWDGKLLDGYAAAHPEILPFRHIGQPSVSIRPVRRASDA